jgi:hypothetical protein
MTSYLIMKGKPYEKLFKRLYIKKTPLKQPNPR